MSSDGAGRSGVYVAIDANIELSEEDGVMDVFGYVKKMRTQRRGLVESLVRNSEIHSPFHLPRTSIQLMVYGEGKRKKYPGKPINILSSEPFLVQHDGELLKGFELTL